MAKHWLGCLVVVLVLSVTGVHPVDASLTFDFQAGSNNWFYGYYGQLGPNGFFGPYDVDASGTGDYAPLNSWVGNRFGDTGQLATGTNASLGSMTVEVAPKVGNDWISVQGRYTIKAYRLNETQGAYQPISPGQLTMWSVQSETPVARISYGKKGFSTGLGLQFGPSRTEEYLTLERSYEVPNLLAGLVRAGYLPRGLLAWFSPHLWPRMPAAEEKEDDKKDNQAQEPENGDDEEDRQTGWPTKKDAFAYAELGPGNLVMGFGFMPWEPIDKNLSWNDSDINADRVRNIMGYLVYSVSELKISAGALYLTYHLGPELRPSAKERQNTRPQDTYITEGWLALQYNNGRWFFNSELDWYNRIIRYQKSQTGNLWENGAEKIVVGGQSGSPFAPQFVESWRFMAELGAVFGPVGIRGFFGFMPGPDRRHGILIDRQPFIQDALHAPIGVFDPYTILLGSLFGSGVDAPAHVSAATVYAAKIDFALAANLTVEASIVKAVRNSDGYGWGYIKPGPYDPVPSKNAYGTVLYESAGDFAISSPSIPDRDLGWEVTAGFTWKLVEGFSLGLTGAHWRPGRWFNYACIDKSVPNWNTAQNAANNWGVNPNRTIDPVVGLEIRFAASY